MKERIMMMRKWWWWWLLLIVICLVTLFCVTKLTTTTKCKLCTDAHWLMTSLSLFLSPVSLVLSLSLQKIVTRKLKPAKCHETIKTCSSTKSRINSKLRKYISKQVTKLIRWKSEWICQTMDYICMSCIKNVIYHKIQPN